MVFIWRGAGIVILVFFIICAWLTSYSFVDTRFGNTAYIGWTMIWTSIPTALLFFMIKNWPKSDPAPGEVPSNNSHWSHSFFFIPVAIWPVIFIVGGLYFINSSEPDLNYGTVETPNEEVLTGERIINFWNPSDDTLNIKTAYIESKEERMNNEIAPGNILFATYEANKYEFNYKNRKRKIKVQGSKFDDSLSYDQAWYILDHKIDLLLLDVTIACSDTVSKEDLTAIDWMGNVVERYQGGQLIEPEIRSKRNIKNTVIDPTFQLPLSHKEKEVIYSLIPIQRDIETSEEYLDSMVIGLCF